MMIITLCFCRHNILFIFLHIWLHNKVNYFIPIKIFLFNFMHIILSY
jgi:hypothetical protein